jgi:hypothetical protein
LGVLTRSNVLFKTQKQMAKLFYTLTLVMLVSVASAQEEPTLEPPKSTKRDSDGIKTLSGQAGHNGGFGALSFRASDFRGETVVLGGFRGGWIVNRTLAIGIEGHGIIPSAKFNDILPDEQAVLLGGYGGMFMEFILFSNEVIHFTFPLSGGAGWMGYHRDWHADSDPMEQLIEEDVFWYLEPGAGVEINISKNFRLATGFSKRFVQDLEMTNTKSSDFGKLNYYITFKIGKF